MRRIIVGRDYCTTSVSVLVSVPEVAVTVTL